MPRYEYQHAFVSYSPAGEVSSALIPIDVAQGLNAWGADGWEVVHMEAVWAWHRDAEHKSWPEGLRGYYVTFKREARAGEARHAATAEAEVPLQRELPPP